MARMTPSMIARRGLRWAPALALALSLAVVGVALAVAGLLTQLPGTAGCVSETGSGGACTNGTALDAAENVSVSNDGKHVYVASTMSDAVAVFARDKKTGALTQLAGTAGCASETGSGGTCTNGTALDGAFGFALSKDGKHVYVGSFLSDAVAAFSRDKKTGALTQLAGTAGCVSETGTGGTCVDGTALDSAGFVSLSKDGKHLYVSSTVSDAVAIFARDKKTGALTQLAGTAGCVSETGSGGTCTDGTGLDSPGGVAVSNDGKHVYVASFNSDSVAIFARDKKTGALTQLAGTSGCVSETGSGGTCADGNALDGPLNLATSKDGKHVYVTSFFSGAVAVFARDKKTGALTQLAGAAGCVSLTGSGGTCAVGTAIDSPESVDVSPDGKHVYVAAGFSDAVAVFTRDKKTGALTQLAGIDGCVSETGSGGACANGTALDGAQGVFVSPDSKHVYVASLFSDAVAAFARSKK